MDFKEAREKPAAEATKKREKSKKALRTIVGVTATCIVVVLVTIWLVGWVADIRSADRSSPRQADRAATMPSVTTAQCDGMAKELAYRKVEGRKKENPGGYCEYFLKVHRGTIVLHATDGRTFTMSSGTKARLDDDFHMAEVSAESETARFTLMLCPKGARANGWTCVR